MAAEYHYTFGSNPLIFNQPGVSFGVDTSHFGQNMWLTSPRKLEEQIGGIIPIVKRKMLGITKRFGFVLQEKLDLCRLKQNAEYPLVIYSLCPFIDDLLIIWWWCPWPTFRLPNSRFPIMDCDNQQGGWTRYDDWLVIYYPINSSQWTIVVSYNSH